MRLYALLFSLVVAVPLGAGACEPPSMPELVISDSNGYEGERAPPAPVARVVSIKRGAKPDVFGSCDDAGEITIAVRDDSPRGYFAYEFRQISGTAPDEIFPSGAYFGGSTGKELQFNFYWFDPPVKNRQEVNLVVRITPITQSGLVGEATELQVSE